MVKIRRSMRSVLMYVTLFLVTCGVGLAITKSMENDVSAKLDQKTMLDYSRSDILFYQPGNKCTAWGKTVASGDTMEEMVFSALRSSGLTDAQAIGIYANIKHEGGDNPVRHEYSFINGGCWSPKDSNGDGLGECSVKTNSGIRYYNNIVLDEDGHWDLFKNTASYDTPCGNNKCQSYGIGLIGFSYGWRVAMLEYIQERDPELVEYFKHPDLYNNLTGNQLIEEIGADVVSQIVALEVEEMLQYGDIGKVVEQLPSGDGVDVAVQSAGIWSAQAERCNTCGIGGSQFVARQETARNVFGQLDGKVFAGSGNRSYCGVIRRGKCLMSENSADGGCTADGFTYFLQSGPSWAGNGYACSTIGYSGCGPTAMAMIITALTNQYVTPNETAAIGSEVGAASCGQGSYGDRLPLIATKYGLKYEKIANASVETVNEWLSKGGMVIFSLGSYAIPVYGNIGGNSGHFIAIRGVTSDGKWLTFDSSATLTPGEIRQGIVSRVDREYNPQDLINAYNYHGRYNMYAIYK